MALASIVHKETKKTLNTPELLLYINRIRRGIPLQADPTIIYIKTDSRLGFYGKKRQKKI